MATNIQAVLAEMPNIDLNDPRQSLLFSKLCEQLGISPAEFDLANQQAQQMQVAQAGQQQPGQPNPQLGSGGQSAISQLTRFGSRQTPGIPQIPQIK